MYTEAKKLHLIEYLLKEQNEQILNKVEKLLTGNSSSPKTDKFKDFKSVLNADEIDALEKTIHDGCEQIDESDWK